MKRILAHPMFIPGLLLAVAAIVYATVPGFRDATHSLWGKATGTEYIPPKIKNEEGPAELVFDAKGDPVGLRLTVDAVRGIRPAPVPARDPNKEPKQQRALPPQFGTVNYDNERLFLIRSRFPGEVAQFTGEGFVARHDLDSGTISPTQFRPIRVGDKVQQNELLAVVWSQTLGTNKAALVDAISALRLSQGAYERAKKVFDEGALSEGSYKQFERQRQADFNTMLTAERSLRFWKLTDKEIDVIKAEAALIAEEKKIRLLEDEVKWARVEIRAPIFKKDGDGKPDPKVWLTVVEKNTNLNDMLDPTATSYPMFKLADLSRLQIMVQPHEEYYPLLRDQLRKGKLKWKIELDAYPNAQPLEPKIVQVLPSLDPGLRTCIVSGYITSDDLPAGTGQDGWFGKYLVGQFATATIFVDPEADTVEIPTNALNEAEGESLVYVQDAKDKDVFYVKRVSVAQRFKEFTYVRSVLTERDQSISIAEQKKGKRRIETLQPGEMVVTHAIVEINRAFETLCARDRLERLQVQNEPIPAPHVD